MMRSRNRRPGWRTTWLALAVWWAAAHDAAADRYEATLTVQPIGAIGRITEHVENTASGDAAVASVSGGGGEVGLRYGLRNWLDIGGEIVATGFTQAIYDPATVAVVGNPVMGRLMRTTRLGQLRAGATLRLGISWVPFLRLGLGVGGRALTSATLQDREHARELDVTPDGMNASFAIDVVASLGIGLEHRLDRRWTVGLGADATHAIGLGTPPLDVVSAGVSLSYTWYPLLW